MDDGEALAQLAYRKITFIKKHLNGYNDLLGLRSWLLERAGIESEGFSPWNTSWGWRNQLKQL
jgi:hypothetical protein